METKITRGVTNSSRVHNILGFSIKFVAPKDTLFSVPAPVLIIGLIDNKQKHLLKNISLHSKTTACMLVATHSFNQLVFHDESVVLVNVTLLPVLKKAQSNQTVSRE